VSQEPWELLRDHDFTEQQWKSILKPLGNVTVTDKDRQAIVITEIVYRSRRFRKFSSGEFGWLDRPAQIAKCLDQVSTVATKLRIALRNASAKLDGETLPHVWAADYDAVIEQNLSFSRHREKWNEFIPQVDSIEKAARNEAQYWSELNAPPANVDSPRDEAWMRLAEIFVTLTGKEPSASPRFSRKDNQSKYADGYGAFVEAFMKAIGESVGDDEIPNFVRTERYRERMQKFLDAHHGLVREH
jgi:hypothetical protein